jgi:glycosyltransferase involved in cell wall biosynthesis
MDYLYKLSICIPTYNRAKHLNNCLQSIMLIEKSNYGDFQICVSDNGSTDNTKEIVKEASNGLQIKYHRNTKNLGIPKNFLNVVEMAEGEFVWLIGDDDLLMPNTVIDLLELINIHKTVDFFYINSFHLNTEYVFSFTQPFKTIHLPKKMKPFSSYTKSGELPFLDLVNPNISFDFLGGMFLAVFRRDNWMKNKHILNEDAINDMRTFSHFDNTFPHVKIFSKAFANSTAYFNARPLSVCLTGAREWSPMQPLVMSVRLVEALELYRKNGLSYINYLRCKNYALNNFIPDIGSMLYYKNTGITYINPLKLILKNFLFPNFYLSLINFIVRKVKIIIK